MSKRNPPSSSPTPKRTPPRRSPSKNRVTLSGTVPATVEEYSSLANVKAVTQSLFIGDGPDPTVRAIISDSLDNVGQSLHFLEAEKQRTSMPDSDIEFNERICALRSQRP